MEWIDGIRCHDHARVARRGYDLPELGRKVIRVFLRHALRDGFFHADMHPGNLFVDGRPARRGRLRHHGPARIERAALPRRNLSASSRRDYRRVAEVHFEAGYVPGASLGGGFRASDPRHRRADPQSPRRGNLDGRSCSTLLFEVTGLFDMQTRPELILLQKTMVVVGRGGAQLDPKLDIWTVADPVVREWITEEISARSDGCRARLPAPASLAACSVGCRRSPRERSLSSSSSRRWRAKG